VTFDDNQVSFELVAFSGANIQYLPHLYNQPLVSYGEFSFKCVTSSSQSTDDTHGLRSFGSQLCIRHN